ncbi:MAG: hypothetical protein ACRD12_18970 [Acidimicrobiales bacterium]
MILILIPLAGIVLGLILWGAMRGLGAFDSLGGSGSGGSWRAERSDRSEWRDRGSMSLRERVEATPRGCLLSVLVACGVWVLGWLILLVIGLSVLS